MNLSIKAYTKTEDKTIKVSDVTGKGIENAGGFFAFSVETSYIEYGNTIDIQVYKEEENITEQFDISGNVIRGKGTYITIECPSNIKSGEYTIKASLSNYESISRNFIIESVDENTITAEFKDEAFLNYIKSLLNNYVENSRELKITAKKEAFEKIIYMENAYFKGITDVTGIEHFTNLKNLNLSYNDICDISPLSNLKNLEVLLLSNNSFTDVSPLSNLTELRELHFSFNKINNLDFIKNMTKLENLCLETSAPDERIDINNIFELKNLKILSLGRWLWITEDDLKDIYKLRELKELILISCNIGDLNFLSNLELEKLYIGNNTFRNPVTGESVSGGTNHFVDLNPISDMTTLRELSLDLIKNVEDLSQLQNLTNLYALWLCEGNLRDASVLDSELFKEKKSWDQLWLYYNQIYDEVQVNDENYIIKDVPKIIQQACDENSVLYSSEGVQLNGCEWEEYGKSVKINPKEHMYSSVSIISGYASNSYYNITLKKEQPKELISITITNSPDKTTYNAGENFDTTGMEVTATYVDGSTKIVTDYIVIDGENLSNQNISVTISYTDNDITKTATQDITVIGNLEIDFGIYETKQGEESIYITKITPETTIEEVLQNIKTNGKIEIYQEKTIVTDFSSKLQTGLKLKVTLNNEHLEYIIVVRGDANGDGAADFKDIVKLNKHRLNKNMLLAGYLEAADVNEDGNVDLKDMVKINKYRLNKIQEL